MFLTAVQLTFVLGIVTGTATDECTRGCLQATSLLHRRQYIQKVATPTLPWDQVLERPSKGDYGPNVPPPPAWCGQWGQDKILDPIFMHIQNGFFVESGARDGVEHSNTLHLERTYNWDGLLVEPSNTEYPKLQLNRRHAFAFHGALSASGRSELIHFEDSGDGLSHMDSGDGLSHMYRRQPGDVFAVPLEVLLQATGRFPTSGTPTVDFWSLDIEGFEGKVLEKTNFTAVEFGVIMIETNHGSANIKKVNDVMKQQQFVKLGATHYNGGNLDTIWANPSYFHKRNIKLPKQLNWPSMWVWEWQY